MPDYRAVASAILRIAKAKHARLCMADRTYYDLSPGGVPEYLTVYESGRERVKSLLFKDVGNHFPRYLTNPLEHWWTERGYSSGLSEICVANHRTQHLQLARATREMAWVLPLRNA